MLSALYAAVARRRRERFAARPELRRRLRRPVVSVGNLAVGGRGKTPLTAALARLLREAGERPAILTRGYARTRPADGVVVVRDPHGIRADLGRSGDEPLMLARQLPGVSILACADRYLAGRFAEHHFGATVHLLDDGFQHLPLERDMDLVILGKEDVRDGRTLPGGRLREPLDTIVAADAVLTTDDEVDLRVRGAELPVFRLRARRAGMPPPDARPVVALAGIAAPDRFFDDLRAAGWPVAAALPFRDHHPYSARDVRRIAQQARAHGARVITTEKDYVRLLPFRPFAFEVVVAPFALEPEPAEAFREWLLDGLRRVRGEHG